MRTYLLQSIVYQQLEQFAVLHQVCILGFNYPATIVSISWSTISEIFNVLNECSRAHFFLNRLVESARTFKLWCCWAQFKIKDTLQYYNFLAELEALSVFLPCSPALWVSPSRLNLTIMIFTLSLANKKKYEFHSEISRLDAFAADTGAHQGIHTFSSILCIELRDNRNGHYLINMTQAAFLTRTTKPFKLPRFFSKPNFIQHHHGD